MAAGLWPPDMLSLRWQRITSITRHGWDSIPCAMPSPGWPGRLAALIAWQEERQDGTLKMTPESAGQKPARTLRNCPRVTCAVSPALTTTVRS